MTFTRLKSLLFNSYYNGSDKNVLALKVIESLFSLKYETSHFLLPSIPSHASEVFSSKSLVRSMIVQPCQLS